MIRKDTIFIRNLRANARIGLGDAERKTPQPIRITAKLEVDPHHNGDDAIDNTTDYSVVRQEILQVAKTFRGKLVETLASSIAQRCLEHPFVTSAQVKIEKLNIFKDAQSVGVEITRSQSFTANGEQHPLFKKLPHTIIMGVLNVTPDSFSDGGLYVDIPAALRRTGQMVDEGADIIDIGGESTRPGSNFVDTKEELRRVIPVLRALRKQLGKNVLLSVDTWKSAVASAALRAGANIINTLGGFQFDPKLKTVIAKAGCPVVPYHIYGTPKTMKGQADEQRDVMKDLWEFFRDQTALALKTGIKKNQLIIDPGIGFGKTLSQNLRIIRELNTLVPLGLPIAVGVSRKSHIGTILQELEHTKEPPSPSHRIEGALAETALMMLGGARIIRTHDVKETRRFVGVLDRLRG